MARERDPEMELLEGVRVLDLTTHLAGPFCTKLLADYGADVLKLEPPGGGDPARRLGPFAGDQPGQERSIPFAYLNANKRSMTLDISCDGGRAIFRRLVERADVVVENSRPGTMESWGLGYAALEKLNPGLVMTSVTPFGQTGPYREWRSSHIVQCALGGWMQGVGDEDGEPIQSGGWAAHYVAGAMGTVGTLVALFYRNATGQGQHVDISGQETMVDAIGTMVASYSIRGEERKRVWGSTLPVRSKNGWVGLNALSARNWMRLCQLMGFDDWAHDPTMAVGYGRRDRLEELRSRSERWASQYTKEEILRRGLEMGATVSVVANAKDVTEIPPHLERNFFAETQHPVIGKLKTPGYLGRVYRPDGPPAPRWSPAPLLGQHNEEVLCGELDYSREDMVRLRQMAVI